MARKGNKTRATFTPRVTVYTGTNILVFGDPYNRNRGRFATLKKR